MKEFTCGRADAKIYVSFLIENGHFVTALPTTQGVRLIMTEKAYAELETYATESLKYAAL